jgi:hypothetical protein
MSNGNMTTDGNYPSNTGLPIDGAIVCKTFQYPRRRVALTIDGTPGTGASYKLQTLYRDTNNASGTWVDVNGASLSGNGAAATGSLVATVVGEAVRLVAANGTTPGTGNNVPKYDLQVYMLQDDEPCVAS